jgi:hypothetical protein
MSCIKNTIIVFKKKCCIGLNKTYPFFENIAVYIYLLNSAIKKTDNLVLTVVDNLEQSIEKVKEIVNKIPKVVKVRKKTGH